MSRFSLKERDCLEKFFKDYLLTTGRKYMTSKYFRDFVMSEKGKLFNLNTLFFK